ncbi:MAG: group II intron reverse transcriptase domain-containing protein [Bdellovibrionales bacterium]|nr:group II intron reverse transcriptase domain-containing protein [Bdellovibrionales bacterium]
MEPRKTRFIWQGCAVELTFEEVVDAYFDCRKNKRNTIHAVAFEFELERNLVDLYQDLIGGHYNIGRSIAFVVEQPKVREIWAGTFRDRIVHHIIYNRLAPRFYPRFIRNSFACIPERGALDGSNRLWSGMRSITRNWQSPSYYLQGDVRNFFVSIDKDILFSQLEPRIVEPWLMDLTRQVVFHDPRENCIMKSKPSAFARVPRHKSLLNTDRNKGLPIGNLTSQFFANVYLDALDQFVKHTLRVKYYYRYVDDWVILGESPGELNNQFDAIQEFLQSKLALELHPFKKQIAPIYQGIDFIGYIHKPYRRQIRTRTAGKMVSLVHQWKKSPYALEDDALIDLRNSLNSYFGISRWGSTYRLRKHIGDGVSGLFIRPDENYLKLIVPQSVPQ